MPPRQTGRYGTQQHLTQEYMNALSRAENPRLEKVQISQGMGAEGHWRAPTVVISYCHGDSQRGRVIFHPGNLATDPDRPGVPPGEALQNWLARRLRIRGPWDCAGPT